MKYRTRTEAKLAQRYREHRGRATKSNIGFNLTFEEWVDIWVKSGHLNQRGCRHGEYCMSRYGDLGAYEIGNVFIQLHKHNIQQAMSGHPKSIEHKENKRKAELGKTYSAETNAKKASPRCTCLICKKETNSIGLIRFHKH